MPPQPSQPGLHLAYVDRLEVPETFVDSLEKALFDGVSLRLEFVVNRIDAPQPPRSPTGKKITACRLIMTPQGFLSMFGQLQTMVAGLQHQGVLQQVQTPAQAKMN